MSRFFFDKNTMIRDYSIVSNKPEIIDRLYDLGVNDTILVNHGLLCDEAIQRIRDHGKSVCFLILFLNDIEEHKEIRKYVFEQNNIEGYIFSNMYQWPLEGIEEFKDNDGIIDDDMYPSPYISIERFLELLEPLMEFIDRFSEGRRWILHTDYDNRCGNCRTELAPDDKYCTMCGTKRGEGAFKPYYNFTDCLYGSPVIMKWKCTKCGNVWADWSYDAERYCKECGGKGEYLKGYAPGGIYEWLNMTEEEFERRKQQLLGE